MITVRVECQDCEHIDNMEAEGVVVLTADKGGGFSCLMHSMSGDQVISVLVVTLTNILRGINSGEDVGKRHGGMSPNLN